MLKRILMMLTLASILGLTGCFHSQVVVDSGYNAAKSTPDHNATYFHIIGLVGIGNTVTLNEVCPNGAGLVENKTIFSINAVTIEQLAVYCK